MKKYEDVRAKAEKEIARLEQCIKDVKKNYTYDFKCPYCNEVSKFRVFTANVGRIGRIYCSTKCRVYAFQEKNGDSRFLRKEINKRREERNRKKDLIINMRKDGFKLIEIAKQLGITTQYASQISVEAKKNDS